MLEPTNYETDYTNPTCEWLGVGVGESVLGKLWTNMA